MEVIIKVSEGNEIHLKKDQLTKEDIQEVAEFLNVPNRKYKAPTLIDNAIENIKKKFEVPGVLKEKNSKIKRTNELLYSLPEEKRVDAKHTHQEQVKKLESLIPTLHPADGEKKSRPRKIELQGSSGSEGFSLSELLGGVVTDERNNVKAAKSKEKIVEKAYKQVPKNKTTLDVVEAEGTCPDCSHVTVIDNLPKRYSYIKCDNCGTKIFVGTQGPKRLGSTRYLSREERFNRNQNKPVGKTSDENQIMRDFEKDALRTELQGYTVNHMIGAAREAGHKKYNGLKKHELIDYLVNNGVYIDHESDQPLKFKEGTSIE